MIKFHDLPTEPMVEDHFIHRMIASGYTRAEAEPLVEKAAALSLAMLRGLDQPIMNASPDEGIRTVIQSLVLTMIANVCRKGVEVNAEQQLYNMIFGRLFR